MLQGTVQAGQEQSAAYVFPRFRKHFKAKLKREAFGKSLTKTALA